MSRYVFGDESLPEGGLSGFATPASMNLLLRDLDQEITDLRGRTPSPGPLQFYHRTLLALQYQIRRDRDLLKLKGESGLRRLARRR